jgi:hypothetical protein
MFFSEHQANLVITWLEVQLGKPSSVGELIKQFVNDWQRVLALNCQEIKVPVVNDESPGLILSAHEQNRRSKCTLAMCDHSLVEHFLNLALDLILEL